MAETKSQKAKRLFENGYNCSQSVFGAFCEDYGIDFDTAMLLSSGFGGGMGRMREVCGTLSGAVMVLGLEYGYSDAKNYEQKAFLYKRYRNLQQNLKKKTAL